MNSVLSARYRFASVIETGVTKFLKRKQFISVEAWPLLTARLPCGCSPAYVPSLLPFVEAGRISLVGQGADREIGYQLLLWAKQA